MANARFSLKPGTTFRMPVTIRGLTPDLAWAARAHVNDPARATDNGRVAAITFALTEREDEPGVFDGEYVLTAAVTAQFRAPAGPGLPDPVILYSDVHAYVADGDVIPSATFELLVEWTPTYG